MIKGVQQYSMTQQDNIHNNPKFNFFIPASIKKSGENGELKISGVSSSIAVDSDGEILEPEGFDFTPLLEKGFYNWNHQAKKSAAAIIGRPTKAEVINGGRDFYTEGFLYKGSEEAQSVYALAQILENEDPERRLGFSIEGQALERDPINPKRITKARITGVAITHCPKNPNTLLSIVKGEYEEAFQEEDDLVKGKDYRELLRGVIARRTGREPEEVEDDELDKAMSVEANQHIVKESVEGKPKEMEQYVTKSETYKQIFEKITNDLKKAQQVFKLVQNIQNMKTDIQTQEISQESIDKAFEILEIAKSESAKSTDSTTSEDNYDKKDEVIEKKGEAVKKSSDKEEKKEEDYEEVVKGYMKEGISKGKMIDRLIKSGHSFEQASSIVGKLCADYTDNKDGGTITQVGKSKESEESTETIEKSEKSDLEKSLDTMSENFGKKFETTTTILKVLQENNEKLTKSLEEMTERLQKSEEILEKIGSQPQGRRSIMSNRQAIERFGKSEDNNGADVINISTREGRAKLGDIIMADIELRKSEGQNTDQLEKAVTSLEIAHKLPQSILPYLQSKKLNIVLG